MPRPRNNKFLHSSATNPLPLIAPSGIRDVKFQIIALKRQRQILIDTPLLATPEKIRAFHVSLMDAIFSLVGADSSKYQNCFRHCIKLCEATDTYKATSWSSWIGLKNFMKVMEKVDRRTRYSNLLHCPAAPDLMVAIAIEKVVLHTQNMGGRNRISDFLKDFDCYNKAASAIYYHQKGNRQDFLTLDQPWDLTASVQRPPTRLADKSELTTSSATSKDRVVVSRNKATRNATGLVENPASIKIESSPEYEAESSAEHQATAHAIQEAGLRATRQPGPLVTSQITPYSVHQVESNIPHQAASHSMNQFSSPAMHQAASHTMLQAGQPAMNQLISTFEHQNTPSLARQSANMLERGREVPVPISMPTQEPSTTGEYCVQVSRADVMESLHPLFGRLKYEDWNGRVQDDIMRVLTEKTVKVITAEAKGMLGLWAGRTNNGVVLSWLEKAQEDLTVFQWIERHEKSTSMTWYSGHIHTVFHDLDMTIAAVLEPTVRDQLRAQVGALRDIIFGKQ